jgi:hypothetical protein
MAVEAGLHILAETPIAHRLTEADALIAAARRRGLKVEVAEQFHRRPRSSSSWPCSPPGCSGASTPPSTTSPGTATTG